MHTLVQLLYVLQKQLVTGINSIDKKDVNLLSAFPNPFNNQTSIKYKLAQASNVKLIIYDLQGQEIIQLLNTFESEGSYSVNWNGSDSNSRPLSPGVYICHMIIDNENAQSIRVLISK